MCYKEGMTACGHDYEPETASGVYLTGAKICRTCGFRAEMSREQLRQHSSYPAHYQAGEDSETITL